MQQKTRTVVLTPSRSRPNKLDRMLNSIASLSVGEVAVYVGIDMDDPSYQDYQDLLKKYKILTIFNDSRKTLSAWTNSLSTAALYSYGVDGTYLVSMGDDHEVKSDLWNLSLMNSIHALDGPGFAYGDDTINGSGLCTAWMASGKVVNALGWMMLPNCKHFYVDNAIMELGQTSNRIAYRPKVVIEHLHPVIEKSEIDKTYIDASSNIEKDLLAFRNWHVGAQFHQDVQTILEVTW